MGWLVTFQKEFWIPNADVMEADQREWEERIAARRVAFLKDHHENGAIWSTWISDAHYCEQISVGIQKWVDDRRGHISYESWDREVLISFPSKEDAILFKLMFGGA